MLKLKVQKIIVALLVALLLTTSAPLLVNAAEVAAPAQQTRAKQVKGLLPGGQFAKIWLGLQPEQPGANVTIVAEWDRPDAASNGVGFFILDQQGLNRVGDEALSTIAIAAGNQNFMLNSPTNMQGAGFNANGTTPYTLVVYNDSSGDANFTITATGAFITDDSNQVTDPSAASTTGAPAAASAPGTTVVTGTTAVTGTVAPAPVATTAPAVATPSTVVTTTTAPTVTTAPAASTATTTGEVRAATLQGDLPTQDAQHFLGLTPSQRDGEITLRLTFDPQDSTELARRLNFWVLDENGLTQFLRGTSPGELAIAAGNRTFLGETNERSASFKAVGLGNYTVIVYNNSSVPGSYTLTVEGGILIDGSAQTRTARTAGVSATGTTTATTPTTTTTTTTTATTTATTTGTTPAASAAPATGREGQPGGTYTVKAGDTLALVARDLYGDYRLYQQICTFNGIANCDVIEVGDVINLPTTAQVQSGATAAAAPAAAAPVATPTRAAQPAASAAITSTAAVTTTTPVTRSTAVTNTRPVTTTRPATTTRTTTSTTASRTTTTGTAPATTTGTLVDALVADGRFSSLVEALQATGLDSVLRGAGPFTVFAPTDAAFAALPEGAFEQLLDDPGGQLTDILRYHVISGSTLSEDLSNNLQATTVQGKSVRFEGQGTSWKVNGATMVENDIGASNGVVHAIDAVILPPPE